MDDARVGAAFRAVRLRRRWRQQDVADRAGVSRALISLMERGHLDAVPLRTLRRVAAVLDIRLGILARWRAGELDRLVNARHSALHESVARFFAGLGGWQAVPEVSFSIWGERGVIDILAWHAPSRSLLVIELKTDIVDVQALVGDVDRKHRLAKTIAAQRGWEAASVSSWVLVASSKTNERRIAAHRTMLRAAFPEDGHTIRRWLADPARSVRGLSSWTDGTRRSARPSRPIRPTAPGPSMPANRGSGATRSRA
jgi:transcriptional regulator with XRE-family HTH domain